MFYIRNSEHISRIKNKIFETKIVEDLDKAWYCAFERDITKYLVKSIFGRDLVFKTDEILLPFFEA